MNDWWTKAGLTDEDVNDITVASMTAEGEPAGNFCTIPVTFDRDGAGEILRGIRLAVSGETESPAHGFLMDLGATMIQQYRVDPEWDPDGLVNEHCEFFAGVADDADEDETEDFESDEEEDDEDDD